jgi:hypothetical protein
MNFDQSCIRQRVHHQDSSNRPTVTVVPLLMTEVRIALLSLQQQQQQQRY